MYVCNFCKFKGSNIKLYRIADIICEAQFSANHQISLLEVIFVIVKFVNHSMACGARSIYVPAAY